MEIWYLGTWTLTKFLKMTITKTLTHQKLQIHNFEILEKQNNYQTAIYTFNVQGEKCLCPKTTPMTMQA